MSNPAFTLEIARRRRARTEPALRIALVRFLRSALTRDTAFFALPDDEARRSSRRHGEPAGQGAMPGAPQLVFVHGGRAFGLELKDRDAALSDAERAAQVVLRDAGMRIEVARDLTEALVRLREMGIPFKPGSLENFRSGRAA